MSFKAHSGTTSTLPPAAQSLTGVANKPSSSSMLENLIGCINADIGQLLYQAAELRKINDSIGLSPADQPLSPPGASAGETLIARLQAAAVHLSNARSMIEAEVRRLEAL